MSAQQRNLPRWRWWEPRPGWQIILFSGIISCFFLFAEIGLLSRRRGIAIYNSWDSLKAGLNAYFSADRSIFSAAEIVTFMVGVSASIFLVDKVEVKVKPPAFKSYYYLGLHFLFWGLCLLIRNTICGFVSLCFGKNVVSYGGPWASLLGCLVVCSLMSFHRDNSIFLDESSKAVFRSKVLLACMEIRLIDAHLKSNKFSLLHRFGMKIFWSKWSFWGLAFWGPAFWGPVIVIALPPFIYLILCVPKQYLLGLSLYFAVLCFFMLSLLVLCQWMLGLARRSWLYQILLEAATGVSSPDRFFTQLSSLFCFLVVLITPWVHFALFYDRVEDFKEFDVVRSSLILAVFWFALLLLYFILHSLFYSWGKEFFVYRFVRNRQNDLVGSSGRLSLDFKFNFILEDSPGVKTVAEDISYDGGSYAGDREEAVAYFVQSIYRLNPRLVNDSFNDVEETLNRRAKIIGLENLSRLDAEGELYRRRKSSPETFNSGGC